jgi:hypothetical protein
LSEQAQRGDLNGIAVCPASGTAAAVFLTGKRWPELIEAPLHEVLDAGRVRACELRRLAAAAAAAAAPG